jgi:hypothetical protein
LTTPCGPAGRTLILPSSTPFDPWVYTCSTTKFFSGQLTHSPASRIDCLSFGSIGFDLSHLIFDLRCEARDRPRRFILDPYAHFRFPYTAIIIIKNARHAVLQHITTYPSSRATSLSTFFSPTLVTPTTIHRSQQQPQDYLNAHLTPFRVDTTDIR